MRYDDIFENGVTMLKQSASAEPSSPPPPAAAPLIRGDTPTGIDPTPPAATPPAPATPPAATPQGGAAPVAGGGAPVQQPPPRGSGGGQSRATAIATGNSSSTPAQTPAQPEQDQSWFNKLGQWAQENYLDVAAVPVGLALMLFGGKWGSVLGALAVGGGGAGLWDRFQNLNNLGGEIPRTPAMTDEQYQAHRLQVIGRRKEVMDQASQGSDTWNQWLSDPENAKFIQSLNMAYTVMPGVVEDEAVRRSPAGSMAMGVAVGTPAEDQVREHLRQQAAAKMYRMTRGAAGREPQ